MIFKTLAIHPTGELTGFGKIPNANARGAAQARDSPESQ
jgi:hypothetical protein